MMATIIYVDEKQTTREQRADALLDGTVLPERCYRTICQIGQGDPETCDDIPEDMVILEKLFEQFNIGDHGGLRMVRSMSVGDIVVLEGNRQLGTGTSTRMYLCAPVGWKLVDGFASAEL